MKCDRSNLFGGMLLGSILMLALPLGAAPLPNGTLLTIRQGVSSYPEGSCTGSYLRYTQDVLNCFPIGPGSDGGLLVGKPQHSGGQETVEGAQRRVGGELSGFILRPQPATLFTTQLDGKAHSDATANLFDDRSCAKSACRGKVEINALHQAYQGAILPGGCNFADCSATGGTGVQQWTVEVDRGYRLDVQWGNVLVHLEGRIVLPGNHAPVAENVSFVVRSGQTLRWRPMVSDADKDALTCVLLPAKYAFYGAMTLETDCSEGVYVPPHDRLVGVQCRQYQVSDGKELSEPAEVCIRILPRTAAKPKERVTPRPPQNF